MQFLARLKPNRPARRNRHLGPRTRISPDPRLPWPHVEYPKTPQLDSLPLGQRVLQALENRVHGMLRLVPWQSRPFNYAMNNILFNQSGTSWLLLLD